jgi:hypothetical protein
MAGGLFAGGTAGFLYGTRVFLSGGWWVQGNDSGDFIAKLMQMGIVGGGVMLFTLAGCTGGLLVGSLVAAFT